MGDRAMLDAAFLVLALGWFGLCLGYAVLCERM
jgi:hypothetical protein